MGTKRDDASCHSSCSCRICRSWYGCDGCEGLRFGENGAAVLDARPALPLIRERSIFLCHTKRSVRFASPKGFSWSVYPAISPCFSRAASFFACISTGDARAEVYVRSRVGSGNTGCAVRDLGDGEERRA